MLGEPRDRAAYRIAFVSLGLALAVALIGVCWLSTERGSTSEVTVRACASHPNSHCKPRVSVSRTSSPGAPSRVWLALAVLGGILVGALIPFPLSGGSSTAAARTEAHCGSKFRTVALGVASISVLVLGVVVISVAHVDSGRCFALGGLLLGLLIPSPAREG